jgi:hypothetical protein
MFIILYGVSCGFHGVVYFILGFFGILIISCMSSYVASLSISYIDLGA